MSSTTLIGTLDAGLSGSPTQFSSTGTAGYAYGTFTLSGNGTFDGLFGGPVLDDFQLALAGNVTNANPKLFTVDARIDSGSSPVTYTTTLRITPGSGGPQYISGPTTFPGSISVQPPEPGTIIPNMISLDGYFRTYYVFQSLIASGQQEILGYLEVHSSAGTTIWNNIDPNVGGILSGLFATIDEGKCSYSCSATSLSAPYESLTLNAIGGGGSIGIQGGAGYGYNVGFNISGTNDLSGIVVTALLTAYDGEGENFYYDSMGNFFESLPTFVPGATWTASIPPNIYRGVDGSQHTLQVFDAKWGICSNVVTFTLSSTGGTGGGGGSTAAIILNPISASAGVRPTVGGNDIEAPNASSMDGQLDGGSWLSVGSFAPATSNGGTWGGLGQASAAGTHTFAVRNSNNTNIISNTVTYVIPGAPPVASPLAALLPNAKQQFCDQNGEPLANGKVYFYVPGTTTTKPVWSDPQEVNLLPQPVPLDGAGRAIIYGNGQYSQLVLDQFGNTIWNQLTQDPISESISGLVISAAMAPVVDATTIQAAVALLGLSVGETVPCTVVATQGTGGGNSTLVATRSGTVTTNPITTEQLGVLIVFTIPTSPGALTGPFTLSGPDGLAGATLYDSPGSSPTQALAAGQLCLVAWSPASSGWVLVNANNTVPYGQAKFTTSGTWTCPQGVTTVWASAAAPGGGGGSCVGNGDAGGGGGGAGQAILEQPLTTVPGTSYNITIGAAGSPGSSSAGGPGGTLTMVSSGGTSLLSLAGGLGGNQGTAPGSAAGGAAGGAGGSPGTPGVWYMVSSLTFGGTGGSGLLGTGGPGAIGAGAGGAPSGYGAGGGGGGPGSGGGTGGGGVLVLKY